MAGFIAGAALTWAIWQILERRHAPGPISDDIVKSRVRARVAALVARPEAITVDVADGVVRLSGNVTPEEREALLHSIVDMPGVVRLRSALSTLRRVA